jgi:glycosyltransferase involved in cell wall biosynthesis
VHASDPAPSVVYVLPDTVGGLLTIIANLLEYRRPDAFEYRAVLTHNRFGTDARFTGHLAADRATAVEFAMPLENIHAVARRLARAIGDGPGVLVCNDFAEMLLLSILDPRRTIVQILHGDYDYYYDLAVTHEPLVHAFVAYSRTVYETLCDRLPHRRDSIFWLSYGVPIPARVRSAAPGPVRLLFVGRLDESKGVFDLPGIERALRGLGVAASWTVVGNGPAGPALRARWTDESVRWVPNATVPEVAAICADHDVFVLPSHAEGLSVATMEAMSAGVVPVVSDLRSMAEIVESDRTGYRVPLGDPAAFADVIARLARDRVRLEAMSRAARQVVVDRFDIRVRSQAYQDLYARWRELYRPRPARVRVPYGSRLDQAWIPNAVVRAVRSAVRMVR